MAKEERMVSFVPEQMKPPTRKKGGKMGKIKVTILESNSGNDFNISLSFPPGETPDEQSLVKCFQNVEQEVNARCISRAYARL